MNGYSNGDIEQTPNEIVSEIRMSSSQIAVLVVEGPSDSRFLGGLVERRAVQLITAHGKSRALEVASGLYAAGLTERTLVLVDRDDDDFRGRDGCVLSTHARDLDTEVMCSTDALRRVAQYHVGCDTEDDLSRFIAWLTRVGTYFLVIRNVSDPSLKLKWASVKEFFDNADVPDTVLVLKRLGIVCDSLPSLAQRVDRDVRANGALLECRGHDLHLIISWKTKNSHFGKDDVQRLFMSTVDLAGFLRTPTGRDIDEWAREKSVNIWRREFSAA